MTPQQLDLALNGFFVYERPDGSRYLSAGNMSKFGVTPIARSGPLSEEDLGGAVDAAKVRHAQRLGIAA